MPTIEDALNFFSYRRSVNAWGVTGPSQLRYLDYFESIIHKEVVPHTQTMKIIQVSFEPIPRFNIGGGEKGCTPFFEIFQLGRERTLLFSSETLSEEFHTFDSRRDEECTFYTDSIVHGDVLFHFKHHSPIHGAEPMFHFGFNVGMVQGNTVITMRHEMEKAEKDPRFPFNFRAIVVMEPYTESTRYDISRVEKASQTELFARTIPSTEMDGSICFRGTPERKKDLVEIARDIGCATKGSYTVKGGWLEFIEHKSAQPKSVRRWVLLKGAMLSFHKSPRELKAQGSINIGSIQIIRMDQLEEFPFTFKLETRGPNGKTKIFLSAPSKSILESWVKAIVYARDLSHVKREPSTEEQAQGTLKIRIGECTSVQLSDELCCTLQLGDQTFTSIITKDQTTSSFDGFPSPNFSSLDFDDQIIFNLENFDSLLTFTLSEAVDEHGPVKVLGQKSILLQELKEKQVSDKWIVLEPLTKPSQQRTVSANSETFEDKTAEASERQLSEGDATSTTPQSNQPEDIPEIAESIQLHVEVHYHSSRSQDLQGAEGELVFSSSLTPSSPMPSEEQSMVTRLRTYDQDMQFNSSSTCPNFAGLPSEYKWISGPPTPKRGSLMKSYSQLRSISVPSRPPDLAATERFELAVSRRYDCKAYQINCVTTTSDELWLGSESGAIHIWEKEGDEFYCIRAHNAGVESLITASGRIWSSSKDEVCVWSSSVSIAGNVALTNYCIVVSMRSSIPS